MSEQPEGTLMRFQDLRHAVRVLWKSRGFTTAAVMTLALGIGVNAAVFILYDAALYESLPARNASELYRVITWSQQGGDHFDFSYPLYVDLRDSPQAHKGMAAYTIDSVAVAAGGHSERVNVEYVTSNYFDVLGIRPVIGPGFSGRDELVGAAPVAIIGHSLWRRIFAEERGVLAKTINVNGREFAIVGVAPRSFEGLVRGKRADLWLSVSQDSNASAATSRTRSWLNLLTRVQPGAAGRVAQQLTSVYRARSIDPAAGQEEIRLLDASRGDSSLVQGLDAPLRLLMATVGLILIIASANVANLLLARSHSRHREIAIRQAIGATRRRIAQQIFAESSVLAVAAGALGLLLAFWFVAVFEVRTPAAALPLRLRLEPNSLVLLFTAAISTCVALAVGLAPAIATSRDLVSVIQRGDGGTRVTGAMTFGRQALAVLQIALCLVLMIGAGLFLRSLARLRSIDPSLNTNRVVAASINLDLRGYKRDRGQPLYRDVLQRVRATPGIQSATLAFVLPVTGGGMRNNLGPRRTTPAVDSAIEYDLVPIADRFFETLGIPFMDGRDFGEEPATGPRVAIVNETFKQRFWPDQNAVGERFSIGSDESYEIVGVVRDTKYRNLREQPRMTMYLPYAQQHMSTMQLVVRTRLPPASTAQALRAAMHQADAQLPLYDVRTMTDHVNRSIYLDRLRASLMSALAVLALTIAAVGVYGLISYDVTERTREVGLRMALGATPAEVVRMLLARGSRLGVIGVLAGTVLAMWLTRQASSGLYGITRLDVIAWLLAPAVLFAVVLVATLVPAVRATRVDPMMASRVD